MDPITLSMAKKHTNKQRLAYENKKSMTLSGEGTLEFVEAPFTDLIGLEVIDMLPGRMFLSAPTEKPNTEGILLEFDNRVSESDDDMSLLEISYGNYNGLLNKPCLLMSGNLHSCCPLFFEFDEITAEGNYNALVYAFEEVADTAGLGITLKKGWYAVNTQTFAIEPFDTETYPLLAMSEWIEAKATADNAAYLKDMFVLKERIEYVVKAENINGGTETFHDTIVSYANISTVEYASVLHSALESFYFIEASHDIVRFMTGTATITYTDSIKPVDPKFLPGVCLPVVELGTVPTEGYTPSAETIAQLDAVSVLDAPIVVKFVGALGTTYTLTINKASMKIDGIDASVYGGITNVANVDNYELNIFGVQTQWEVFVSKVSGS